MTVDQKVKFKKMFQQVEVIAGDLQEMFKAEAVKLVSENPCEFASTIQNGKSFEDKFLRELANAQSEAWVLFARLDALSAGDAVEKPLTGQTFDVTYHVAYKAPVLVPLGESLVDNLKDGFLLPNVPIGQKEVGFKIEKVELDGFVVPNPREGV